mmetsp:Transcript_31733/g.103122  ORF Transcript_31733/g.103122 Transcript_31733/m.103122 type:complete len:251 (-) Transcript_31733:269-1021(-)
MGSFKLRTNTRRAKLRGKNDVRLEGKDERVRGEVAVYRMPALVHGRRAVPGPLRVLRRAAVRRVVRLRRAPAGGRPRVGEARGRRDLRGRRPRRLGRLRRGRRRAPRRRPRAPRRPDPPRPVRERLRRGDPHRDEERGRAPAERAPRRRGVASAAPGAPRPRAHPERLAAGDRRRDPRGFGRRDTRRRRAARRRVAPRRRPHGRPRNRLRRELPRCGPPVRRAPLHGGRGPAPRARDVRGPLAGRAENRR